MTEEERKDYLKYIENYTINDLADIFNTQNFVIQDKDKFNEILLYYHFKQNEEIEQLQQENKQLEENYDRIYNENCILRENAEHNDKVVDKFNWENQKLKKQLEEYKKLGFEHLNDKCNKLENQQKEFIEWLENEKNIYPCDISDYIYEDIINTILLNEAMMFENNEEIIEIKEKVKES